MTSGLVDQYERPISTVKLKQEQAAPTTRGVRQHYALHPAANLTPGKLANLLRDSIDGDPEAYLALAEDMEERNEHYAGVIGTRKRQVSGLTITVEAAGDDAQSVAAAELVREVIDRDSFEDELFDILDAIGKGFSATEIIWDTSEGQWRPKALKWRDPRWFVFDQTDGETLLLRDVAGNAPLEPYKWITHFAKVKSGLPIRGGLARASAWTFLFKSFSAKDWAIFCEAYGQPLRLGKYGPGASEADKETLLRAVSTIGVDFAAIIPQSMLIEIVGANLSGNHELYEKRCDWLDRQTSKLVLGQTATTDAIAGGHAVGKTHDGVRDDIEKSDARQLRATLVRDLFRALIDLNMGPQKSYPRVKIGREDEVDVEKLVKNVATLVPFGLKVGMSTMRDKLGLPDPEDGEELLTPAKAEPAPGNVPPAPPAAQLSVNSASLASVPSDSKGRDAIDRATASILEDEGWEALVAPMVAGLESRIAKCKNLDEVTAVLSSQFEHMSVAALTEKLAQAAFAARLAGETDEPLSDGV
jgi:phage gp29-like protein